MTISEQIAKHFRDVHFGGNWTASNLQDKLSDLTWQQAIQQVADLHSIATLVYHINYYVDAVYDVLQGKSLDAKDKYSFDCPPITCQQDWEALQKKLWSDAKACAEQMAKLPDEKLFETFVDEKYGNYYRNLHGLIEHCHYHLGQISLIRSLLP